MSHELVPYSQHLESTPEVSQSAEMLPRSPRIIIFGNRVGGAFDLVGAINDQLQAKDVQDIDVYGSRNVANIEDTFFGRGKFGYMQGMPAPAETPEQPALTSLDKKLSLLQRLGKILANRTTETVPVPEPVSQPQPEAARDTLPLGIIAFPQMRHYDISGSNMPTPYDKIEALAEKYGVPVVRAERIEAPTELEQALDQLWPQSPQLPPTA